MAATARELLPCQRPAIQRREVRRTHVREAFEQGLQRPAPKARELRQAVEGVERPCFAVLQDDARPRDPVGLVAMNQVPEDIDGAPGLGTLVGLRPLRWQVLEKTCQRT